MLTLKEIREKSNKTQKQISEALGITESYYCLIENNKRKLSLEHAYKLSKIYQVSMDEIFLSTNFTVCQE
jgi:putative transcriptional regulator